MASYEINGLGGRRMSQLIGESLIERIKQMHVKDDNEYQDLVGLVNQAVSGKPADNKSELLDDLKTDLNKIVEEASARSLLSGIDVEEIQPMIQDFMDTIKTCIQRAKAAGHDRIFSEKEMTAALKVVVDNSRENSCLPDLSISASETVKLKVKVSKVVDKMCRRRSSSRMPLRTPRPEPEAPKPLARSVSTNDLRKVGANSQESKIGDLIKQLEVKFSKIPVPKDVVEKEDNQSEIPAIPSPEETRNNLDKFLKEHVQHQKERQDQEDQLQEIHKNFKSLKQAILGVDDGCLDTLGVLYKMSQGQDLDAKVGPRHFAKLENLRLELNKNLNVVSKALKF